MTDAEAVALVAVHGAGTIITKDSFRPTQPMLRTAVRLIQMSLMLRQLQRHLVAVLPGETARLTELAG